MGVEFEKVRDLTAHKDSTMNREIYVQQSAKNTVEIQLKRGLISNKEATGEERESDGKI